MPSVLRWVHVDMDERELRSRVKNKMIRPTTIPQTLEALIFEQAVSREALRLAYIQHKTFAITLKGVQQQRTIADTFSQSAAGASIVDNMKLDLLVASGGVLSHAPRMEQTALMMIDAFEPEGFTEIAKDSIFMMPHLGVLASVHPRAALEVFERDCLIALGTVIAPRGTGKYGQLCFEYEITGTGWKEQGAMTCGELKRFPLDIGQTARVVVRPARGFDLGNGPGQMVEREVRGGLVGIILDSRGRPLMLPSDRNECRQLVSSWVRALDLYVG